MKRRNREMLAALAILFATCAPSAAQTIAVGTGCGPRGGTVEVPVTLSGQGEYTAVLVRLEYDPAVLTSPSVAAGPLLSAGHALDFHSPEPGRLNVAVYPNVGMPAFAAQSGTLFTLRFHVRPTAPGGESAIGFTTKGTPSLPASDLTDTTGAVAAHTTQEGKVLVGGTAARSSWMLYE